MPYKYGQLTHKFWRFIYFYLILVFYLFGPFLLNIQLFHLRLCPRCLFTISFQYACKLLSFAVSNWPIKNEQLVFEAHRVKFEYELHEMRTNRLFKSMSRSIDQCSKLTSFETTSRFSNSLISLVFFNSWHHLSSICDSSQDVSSELHVFARCWPQS